MIHNPLNKSLRAPSKKSHSTANNQTLRHPPVTVFFFLFGLPAVACSAQSDFVHLLAVVGGRRH